MKQSPSVSVVMSACNAEKYVVEAVKSILGQTFHDFEFIIINDGSTDRTLELLEAFHDSRIKLISQPNRGLTSSLNRGLQLARGRYIARMDADDISLPERLEKQVELFEENPSLGLVSCSFYEIDTQGRKINLCCLPTDNEAIKKNLLTCNQFCHGAVTFRKACVESVGYYREFFAFAQDFDLWLRIAEKYQCANIETPLYQWRFNPESQFFNSFSHSNNQCLYAAFAIVLAHERKQCGQDRLSRFPLRKWDPEKDIGIGTRMRVLSTLYSMTSRALEKRGDIASAKMLARKACYNNPFRLQNWKHLFALLP